VDPRAVQTAVVMRKKLRPCCKSCMRHTAAKSGKVLQFGVRKVSKRVPCDCNFHWSLLKYTSPVNSLSMVHGIMPHYNTYYIGKCLFKAHILIHTRTLHVYLSISVRTPFFTLLKSVTLCESSKRPKGSLHTMHSLYAFHTQNA
jgi:hypothetical protein